MDIDPYPFEFERTHNTKEILEEFDDIEGTIVSIPGRITSLRKMGRASFAHIADMHSKIQIYVREDKIGKDTKRTRKWQHSEIGMPWVK